MEHTFVVGTILVTILALGRARSGNAPLLVSEARIASFVQRANAAV